MIDSERRESRIRIPRPGVMGLLRSEGMLRASGMRFMRDPDPTRERISIGMSAYRV